MLPPKKLEGCPYQMVKKFDDMFIRLDTIPAFYGHMDGRTERRDWKTISCFARYSC